MSRYEVEEETGGYVRVGDVLEWRYKGQPAPDATPVTTEAAPKRKTTRKTRKTTRKAKK